MENPYFTHEVTEVCAICTEHLKENPSPSHLLTEWYATALVKVHEVLESFSKFKFSESGPQYICSVCFDLTTKAFKFQQICNRAQMFYDQYVQETYQESTETESVSSSKSTSDVPTQPETDRNEDTTLKKQIVSDLQLSDHEKNKTSTDNFPTHEQEVVVEPDQEHYQLPNHAVHVQQVHGVLIKPEAIKVTLSCQECGIQFIDFYALSTYLPIQSANIMCNICYKAFVGNMQELYLARTLNATGGDSAYYYKQERKRENQPSPKKMKLDNLHYLQFIPPTDKKFHPTQLCCVCTKANKRRETRYVCATCEEKPALCVQSCFKTYHSE